MQNFNETISDSLPEVNVNSRLMFKETKKNSLPALYPSNKAKSGEYE